VATQTCTKWRPKPRQKRILEAAQTAGFDRTITAICEEAKVPRRTFYYWLEKDPCFADAWDKVWRRAIVRHMPSVVAAMALKARKGDVGAGRLIADLAGAVKQIHEVTSPLSINLRWDDDNSEKEVTEQEET
jgi:hypothetical protein